jgi:hypothetical protein
VPAHFTMELLWRRGNNKVYYTTGRWLELCRVASCVKWRPGSPTRPEGKLVSHPSLMPKSTERDPTRGGHRHHNRYRRKQKREIRVDGELAAVMGAD